MEEVVRSLVEKLERLDSSKFRVVSLPDFFLDIIIKFDRMNFFLENVDKIYRQGGGNISIERPIITSGGNAANTALALARLGVKSHLICKTSELGKVIASHFLQGVNGKFKTSKEMSITASFEIEGRNIMFSYPGPAGDFSFEDLGEDDLEIISSSDLLYVGNWNLNRKGTELVEKVFNFAKSKGTKTYLDIGDPSTKLDEIDSLIDVLSSGCADIMSLNENELKYLSTKLGIDEKNPFDAIPCIEQVLKTRIDLHTKSYSFSRGKMVKTFEIKPRAVTGAGDAWNAGNILGELIGLNDTERLLLANAVAAVYLTSFPNRGSLEDVKNFLASYNFFTK